MEKQLTKTFKYMKAPIRVICIDGEPWWVLNDVCAILEISNPRNVAARLDKDEKDVHLMDTLGGVQEMTVITESGLYEVILRSDKPDAKKFRRWVTHEVIPSIRTQGFYGLPTKQAAMALCRKVGVTLDDYAKFKTGRSLTDRVKDAKQEAEEVVDWSTYRFSVQDIMADTGATHGDILNMARKKKIDRKKSLPNMYRVS